MLSEEQYQSKEKSGGKAHSMKPEAHPIAAGVAG
jgi:hypothetical protein